MIDGESPRDTPSIALDNALNEALALHSLFCTLGYMPRDLYFVTQVRKGQTQVGLMIKWADKEFFATTGFVEMVPTDVQTKWRERVTQWNEKATKEEKDALVNQSEARSRFVELVVALRAKGM